MRWIIAGLFCLVSSGALAQGCGPQNPNCVVPDRPQGDSSNAAANTRFVQANGTGGAIFNIENSYGGIPGAAPFAPSAQNLAAINSAIAAAPANGTILIPRNHYAVNGTIVINKPLGITCGAPNSIQNNIYADNTMPNLDLFLVNSNDVVFMNCTMGRAGAAGTGNGVTVGNDSISVSDATCVNGSSTVTSASNGFTGAAVGQKIALPGCGAGGAPLFATFGSVAPGSVSLIGAGGLPVTAGNNATVTAKWGTAYTNLQFINTSFSNHNAGMHFIDAARWRVYGYTGTNNIGLWSEDQLDPDFGTNNITASTVTCQSAAAGQYGFYLQSGGDMFFDATTKALGCQYGVYMQWNVGLSGNLLWYGSIENCGTNGFFISPQFQFNNVIIKGQMTCGATGVVFDNASTSFINGANISATFGGAVQTAIDAGKVTGLDATGSTILSAGGTAIVLRANSTNARVGPNMISGAALTVSSASATAKILDPIGMTTANLPVTVANGSQIWASDADPGSNPCSHSGAQTGIMAFRQNGAWVCTTGSTGGGGSIPTGTQGGIPYYNSTTTVASSPVLPQFNVVLGGGTASTPTAVATLGTSGQVLTSAGAGNPPAWGTPPGGGNVSTAGTLTSNSVVVGQGAQSVAVIPAGTNGQLLLGVLAGPPAFQTMSGDAVITSAGAVTVTKTNGTVFAASATTDATNANNLSSGTVPAARMPALTGDVTSTAGSVATSISGGAVTLPKMANLAANSILGNNTGSPATPIALTQAQHTAMLPNITHPQGRCTLQSGTPVMFGAGVTAQNTVYFTPYLGTYVPIYNGTQWVLTNTGGEISQLTTDTAKSPAAVAANSVYDVFVWNDAGTIRATRGPAWTGPNTRSLNLTLQNGFWVNGTAITNGPGALQGTYVCTIVSNATSTIDYTIATAPASGGTAASIGVWNMYNRVSTIPKVIDNGSNYTYTSSTIRQCRGSTGMQINFVLGQRDDAVTTQISVILGPAAGGATARAGPVFDSITAFGSNQILVTGGAGIGTGGSITEGTNLAPGTHFAACVEASDNTNANNFSIASNNSLLAIMRN